MKIGIVGSGMVGATAAYAMVMQGVGREIVLVDLNPQRAQAEADDIYHAVPFAAPLEIHAGTYADLKDSRVVIVAAGVAQKPGETRLQLLSRNAAVFRQVIPAILEQAPAAILLIATNPVDIMTHISARVAAAHGVSSRRVIGSGTTLDTARFRSLLARHVGIDSRHIHAVVIGEHGDSEVLVWSRATVGGVPLAEFCAEQKIPLDDRIKATIDEKVRRAAYHIIAGKGSTYYGIGSALARIVDVLLHDQRSIMTICTPEADIAGVKDVTVAMPHILGGDGVLDDHISLTLDDDEQAQLHASATLIRRLIDDLEAQGDL
ncbi:MAG: L-lactate dehydrogenase [Anaerolineae bacterium]|nr:L-lactate dehydrogenase [Anaerolineae bacterium]